MLNIDYVYSPNYDERPDWCHIDCIVIHAISLPPECYGSGDIQLFFQNCLPLDKHEFYREIADLKVSSHFLIERSGQVSQFVATDKRAWHAGQSYFQGRQSVNDFSIGIELEGCDNDCFTEIQYIRLASLCHDLMRLYPQISLNRIVGHCDIAPGRKTDPGPHFDWLSLHTKLRDLFESSELTFD